MSHYRLFSVNSQGIGQFFQCILGGVGSILVTSFDAEQSATIQLPDDTLYYSGWVADAGDGPGIYFTLDSGDAMQSYSQQLDGTWHSSYSGYYSFSTDPLPVTLQTIDTIYIYKGSDPEVYEHAPQHYSGQAEQDEAWARAFANYGELLVRLELRDGNFNAYILSEGDVSSPFLVFDGEPLTDFVINGPAGSIPIATGGTLRLLNDDILEVTDPEYYLDSTWTSYFDVGDGVTGLGVTVASGHTCTVYLMRATSRWDSQSGYYFFDYNSGNTSEGSIIKLYDIYPLQDLYDVCSGNTDIPEKNLIRAGYRPMVVLESVNGQWVSRPLGQQFDIGNNNFLYVSFIISYTGYSERGIGYYRSDGAESLGYYFRNGELVSHSSHEWLGFDSYTPTINNNDEIFIYSYPGQYDQAGISDYSDYEEAAEVLPLLIHLRFNNGIWNRV